MAGMPEWLGKPEAMRAVDRYFSGENVENYRGALARLLRNPDLLDVATNERGVELSDAERELAHFKRDWVGTAEDRAIYWSGTDPDLVQNKIRATFIAALARALDDHAAGDALRPISMIWVCADLPDVPGHGEVFEAGLTIDTDSITVVLATSRPPDTPAAGDTALVATGDGLKLRGNVETMNPDAEQPGIGQALRIVETKGSVSARAADGSTLWSVDASGHLTRGS